MNLDNVKKFIELAKHEGVAELKYEDKELKIAVNFNSQPTSAIQAFSHTNQVSEVGSSSSENSVVDANIYIVTSPFVGTYYAASSPDKDNFVTVGQKVSAGQTLCILEAMKIMNEIESDMGGEIVEICVENEPIEGDYYSDEANSYLREAGELFDDYDGIDTMQKEIMWIPKRYRRNAELEWDGIGEWMG